MRNSSNTSSLKARVLRAGGWTLGGHFFGALIRLGGNLVLTRLLVPEMFGLMAIVYVLITGFALFSDIGLGPNIVQSKRGDDPVFLDTIWIIQIIRGALIWLLATALSALLYVLASNQWFPAESVYAQPLLPLVIVIYSSSQLITGFYPTKFLLARRQFSLERLTQIDIATQFIGLIVMVTWAYLDRTIWALVAGTLVTAIVKLPLYHLFLPGESNRWRWDSKAFKEIIGFGKWIFLSSIMGFLVINGDRLLLGGLVSARQLGLYSIAYLFASFLPQIVQQLTMRVAFPALSEVVRNHPHQVLKTYYKFRLPFDLVLLFFSGFLLTFGSALIHLLYDHRYHEAGPIMQILALSLISSRYLLSEQCYLALGKPKLLTPIYLVRLLALVLLVPAAFKVYGFDGAIYAIALSPFASLPIIIFFKMKCNIFDWKQELLVLPIILVGAGAGMLLASVGTSLQSLISPLSNLIH